MGTCLSVRIKAESMSNTGLTSKNMSKDTCDLSCSSCSMLSMSSGSLMPWTQGEILQFPNLKCFSFSELKAATRNFRPDSVLGEGGFGAVFKGWVDEHTLAPARPGTGLVVAVKKLNKEGIQGHKEWLAEINYLGRFQHPNLVRLMGYCFEEEHRLLVYEFMARGCMENHLFRRGGGGGAHFRPISWAVRMQVALGAARGLAFLHNAERTIIYRDFKTSNILLDMDYNPKLSDFGMARDGPKDERSHVSTRVVGTHGYAAPEYISTGRLTTKSDVFSFGVVLLEMISGRRTLDKNRPFGEHNLVEWARPFLGSRQRIFRVLDPHMEGQYSLGRALKAAMLALRCVSLEPTLRPDMDEVVAVLELLQAPKDGAKSVKHSLSNIDPMDIPVHAN